VLAEAAVAVGLAAADSLNPTTIGQATVLAVGRRPLRAILSFWAGAFLCYLALGVLLVLGPGQLLEDVLRRPPPGLRVAELVLAVAALVGSVLLWRRRRSLRLGRRLVEGDADLAFRLGALVTLTDLPTAFPYYALVALLSASGLSELAQLGVLVLYTFLYLLPVLAILAVRLIAGPRAEPRLAAVRDFVEREAVTIAALVLGFVGAALLVHAVATFVLG
jgi:cytochrome c biogenesis protein CcdA